jgi:hypothetical protein
VLPLGAEIRLSAFFSFPTHDKYSLNGGAEFLS